MHGQRRDKKKQHKSLENRGKIRKEPDFKSLQRAKDKLSKQAKNRNKMIHEQDKTDRYEEIHQAMDNPEDVTIEQTAAHEAYRTKYFGQFKKVVEAADVLLEVLDVRDPLGCRSVKLENYILKRGKKIVLILNKADLVPVEVVNKWLTFLRREFPTVVFKSSSQPNKSTYVPLHDGKWRSTDCFGIDDLMGLLNKLAGGTSICAGVIGPPNAGKSSVINTLSRRNGAGVASTPGFTKTMQEIEVTKRIKILDCPGVVSSSGTDITPSMVLRNSIKIELLDDPIKPVSFILEKVPKEQLVLVYGINTYSSADDFLSQLAVKRGRILKGGEPDMESMARIVLDDWNRGRIKYYTIPPDVDDTVETHTELVDGYGGVYNMDRTIDYKEDDFRSFQIQHVFQVVNKNIHDKPGTNDDDESGEEEHKVEINKTELPEDQREELNQLAQEYQGVNFLDL